MEEKIILSSNQIYSFYLNYNYTLLMGKIYLYYNNEACFIENYLNDKTTYKKYEIVYNAFLIWNQKHQLTHSLGYVSTNNFYEIKIKLIMNSYFHF
jgi:hypothetical protein